MIDSQRRRRGHHAERRRDLVRARRCRSRSSTTSPSTTACRTTSSGDMQDLGTASGPEQQPARRRHRASATGTRSAAARPATLRPTRPTRTSSTPASTAATSPATTTAPGRRATSASTRTTRPATAPRTRRYRFQWTAPILVSPHDPQDRLPRRQRAVPHDATAGQTWAAISPDLTRNDKTKQKWSGGPITGDNTGVEIYCTIFALAESPQAEGPALGRQRRRAGPRLAGRRRRPGRTSRRPSPACPSGARSAASSRRRSTRGTAYVVVDAHRLDDMRPYLWKTTDFGKTWKSLAGEPAAGRLPARRPRGPGQARAALPRHRARRVLLARRRRQLAGAEAQPADRGGARSRGQGQRPGRRHQRPVDLDPRRPDAGARVDAAPSRQKDAHLFPARPAVRWRTDSAMTRFLKGSGDNPPRGALFQYWLGKKAEGRRHARGAGRRRHGGAHASRARRRTRTNRRTTRATATTRTARLSTDDRPAPRRLGPRLRAGAKMIPRPGSTAAIRPGSAGASRDVHGEADREREDRDDDRSRCVPIRG